MNMKNSESPDNCEFCTEIGQPWLSRYRSIYGLDAINRIVDRQGGVVAMPSLGQLFQGSFMILPTRHVETMADLDIVEQADFLTLLGRLKHKVSSLGLPIVFEHGARCHTGGSCGIYHAHLHVVPVPHPVAVADLLPGWSSSGVGLPEALVRVSGADQYLLLQDTNGDVAVGPLSAKTGRAYPSQYFRQAICRCFSIEQNWDWRCYGSEPLLKATIAWYTHV